MAYYQLESNATNEAHALKEFVLKLTSTILKNVDRQHVHILPGNLNPADLITRKLEDDAKAKDFFDQCKIYPKNSIQQLAQHTETCHKLRKVNPLIEELRKAANGALEIQNEIKYEMDSLAIIQNDEVIEDTSTTVQIREIINDYDAQVFSLNMALAHLATQNKRDADRKAETDQMAKVQVDTVKGIVDIFSKELAGSRCAPKTSNVKREAIPCVPFDHEVSRWSDWYKQFEIFADGYTEIEKMMCRVTKVDTRSKRLIQYIPTSESGYRQALVILQDAFGDESKMMQDLVTAFMKFIQESTDQDGQIDKIRED